MTERSNVHPDRVGVDPWIFGGLVAGGAVVGAITGLVLLEAFGGGPFGSMAVGALVGAGMIVGVRSVSPQVVARVVVVLSAIAQLRLGVLGDSLLTGSQITLGWVVAAATTLVLSDLVETTARPVMQGWSPPPARTAAWYRSVATVVALLGFVLVVAPLILPIVSSSAQSGQGPRLRPDSGEGPTIRATDSLDMTTRPELSDDVMFTVASNRGTFWRGQTYDAWDGRRWTRTDGRRLPLGPDSTVVHSIDDVGATGGDVVTQRFRMETTYSDVVFAAASAVEVDIRHDVLQGADGTLVTAGRALGRDSTYTVVSRRPVLDEALLRSAPDDVPAELLDRYAGDPVASDRVLQAARDATAGADNTYDRIRALERWMGERTEYSLDAPLSPVGVDVVDHFLFESRLGWCEQVASSLVVLARANGIPARLVTGFVPGEVDRLTGTYVVRGRDAHAWAEVWFSGIGWVPFDPTASVPLAGADQADRSFGEWVLDHAVVLLVGAAVLTVVVVVLVRLWRWARRRRTARPVGWVQVTDHRLAELGRRAGWPRAACETASRYAGSLARHVGDPRVTEVGAAIDDALYAPSGPDDETRSRVDHILDTVDLEGVRSGHAPTLVDATSGPPTT